jgi:hypothetical protein
MSKHAITATSVLWLRDGRATRGSGISPGADAAATVTTAEALDTPGSLRGAAADEEYADLHEEACSPWGSVLPLLRVGSPSLLGSFGAETSRTKGSWRRHDTPEMSGHVAPDVDDTSVDNASLGGASRRRSAARAEAAGTSTAVRSASIMAAD